MHFVCNSSTSVRIRMTTLALSFVNRSATRPQHLASSIPVLGRRVEHQDHVAAQQEQGRRGRRRRHRRVAGTDPGLLQHHEPALRPAAAGPRPRRAGVARRPSIEQAWTIVFLRRINPCRYLKFFFTSAKKAVRRSTCPRRGTDARRRRP